MTRVRMTTLAVLLALAAVACDSTEDGVTTTVAATVVPTTTTATSAASTTTLSEFGSVDARDVAVAYFAAYNEGDVDAVVALFGPDATFSDNFGSQGRAAWEQLLVWNAAQGTVLGPPSCLLAEELVGVSVRLVCSHGNSGAAVQAVDGPAVPIRLTLEITPEGIVDWKSIFEQPDFNVVGIPFSDWMATHHPDIVAGVEFGNWSSVEQAEQNGILNAEYAAEWRVYLDANDCAYDEGC